MAKTTNTTKILWEQAKVVFLKWHKKSAGPLRLLGFGTSGLAVEGSGQKELFKNPQEERQKRIDKAFDIIRGKYGDDAVRWGR
jgi:hypothetical protein